MNFGRLFIFILSLLILEQSKGLENFSIRKLKIATKTIEVEVAETEAQLEQGLMFRKSLKENSGMLFIFKDEKILSFWMKNTYVDLSIAYINKKKKITEIIDMVAVPPGSKMYPTSYPSKLANQYALEMNRGWFEKNKIKVGTQLDF